jgi:hypothetical protein
VREFTTYSYKRKNHFNEWLQKFQAKQTTEIPDSVYQNIIREVNKTHVKSLTIEILDAALRRLKYSKYYEHIHYILFHLTGKPAPSLDSKTEDRLRAMFAEIQIPFAMFCPKTRKTFVSYAFIFHNFFQLLEMDEYLVYFNLLSNVELLHEQQKIWKKICGYLRWQYIRSI